MKKLTLALVAFLAVGASAQGRHYVGQNGVIHALPAGTVDTHVVEIAPVLVTPFIPVTTTRQVILVPTNRTYVVERDVDTANVDLLINQDFDAYEDGDYDYHLDRARYDRNYQYRDND